MNMKEYLELSSRTAAGVMHTALVNPAYVLHEIMAFIAASAVLDKVKKCLFYNRTQLEYTTAQDYSLPAIFTGMSTDTIHALLGIMSEAGELAELMQNALATGEAIPKAKLIDESGDIMWYMAMLFRELDTNFEEVGERNINKLMIRFPDKFTFDAANNKDHSAEDRAFEV